MFSFEKIPKRFGRRSIRPRHGHRLCGGLSCSAAGRCGGDLYRGQCHWQHLGAANGRLEWNGKVRGWRLEEINLNGFYIEWFKIMVQKVNAWIWYVVWFLFVFCSLILMLIDAPPWLIHRPIPDHGGPYTTAEQLSIAERLRPEIWE